MLRVAFIADEQPVAKPKKLTSQQKLHNDALAAIANSRILARKKVKTMFAKEIEEIEQLKKKLASYDSI